jgi:WD repeat-containing protein 61
MHDLALHPLAVTSLSVSKDGRRALSASLDGTLVLMHPKEGKVLGKLETGREGQFALSLYCTLYREEGLTSARISRGDE